MPVSEKNRRAAERKRAEFFAPLHIVGDPGEPWVTATCRVMDLSLTGARLLVAKKLKKDAEVELELQPATLPRSFRIPGTIMWCRAEKSDRFEVGVRIERLRSDDRAAIEAVLGQGRRDRLVLVQNWSR